MKSGKSSNNLYDRMTKEIEPKDERALPSSLARTILDSSLISATNSQLLYNIKLVACGDYLQLYFLENSKIKPKEKNIKNDFDELNLRKYTNNNHDKDYISLQSIDEKKFRLLCCSKEFWNIVELKKYKLLNFPINNKFKIIITTNTLKCDEKIKNIELKNIIRSKLSCQRLSKCNSKEWKTFITLTIAENLTDIEKANNIFHKFITQVRRAFKDFKYIAIPEFQKRGAIHYHLLSNIDLDNKVIYKQVDNKKFLHIKYWKEGFTKVDKVKGDIKKIVGYISKYMTKDIDDRLFGKHRYLYSQNLIKPSVIYINSNNLEELKFLTKILENRSLIYENNYINSYNNEKIAFNEYLTNF